MRRRVVGMCAVVAALAACTGCEEDAVVFTAAGDYGTTAEAAATLGLIEGSAARFHLALGDLSYDDRPESRWCEWVTERVGQAFPFMLVPGNHEDDFGENGHISRFVACLPDRIGVTGVYPTEYFFDVDDVVRTIMISPDMTVGGTHYYYGEGNRHYTWLAGAIDGARAAGMRWVVVGMHKSCVSVGQYYCAIYSELMDLLLQKRVDLILHGHDHSYQRTRQLALGPQCPSLPLDGYNRACVADAGDDEYVQGHGTVSVIVATAGQPFYELQSDDPEAGYFARVMDPAAARHGLLKIEATAAQLAAEFVPSTGTSQFVDQFVIRTAPR